MTPTALSALSTRMTPAGPATASKASTRPAKEPVWDRAARRPPSDTPILSTTTGLPASRAARHESRKSPERRTASTRQKISRTSGSVTKYRT